VIENIRFALRQIRKNPGFATLAIVTLALGIGANAAMFTVIDSVMLRPLPYRDADRIVAITTGAVAEHNAIHTTSWLNYLDIKEQARQFQSVAAYTIDFGVVRTPQTSQATTSVKATASLFKVLGVTPSLGRPFLDSDNEPGAPNVVILTFPFWREHFGSDAHAIGQQVHIGDAPYTIVGVLPADFRFSGNDASSGVWLPYQPDSMSLKERNSNFLYLIGSLRGEVSQHSAQDERASIAHGIAQKDPQHAKDIKLRLIPFQEVVTSRVRPVFLALTGALILVLLIACANVANLLLARCLARSQELAIRTALGASRRALLLQMLIEGGVLCVFGAAVGVGLAHFMLEGVHHLPPDLIPRAEEIHLRLSVFFALLGATIVVTLLSSIAPALVATRSDPQAVLQEGSRGASFGRGRSRLRGLMVAGEVALSVILLVSGGLMFRTLYKLQHIYLGFEKDNITSFITFPGNAAGFFSFDKKQATSQDQSIAFRVYQPMADKLSQLPGVVDVGYANSLPFEGIDMNTSFDVVGRLRPPDEPNKNHALMRAVSGSYLRTMKTPVVRGRAITDEDTASSPYVIMINETMAKQYFSGQDPIGQQIDFAGRGKDREDSGMTLPYRIVGVIADAVQQTIGQPPTPEVDLAYPQVPVNSFYYQVLVRQETNYVVKTRGPVEIVSAIRNAFHEAQPEFALDDFKTMQTAHDQADFNQRLGLYLVGSFAGIAIVMVLAGLYGVLSQIVGQRRREIGIRMALGADRTSILTMMFRRGFVLTGIGLAVGLIVSVAAVQSLKSFLYGVSPVDAVTYIAVAFILFAVGTLAALIPARRAATIEPTQALRAE